MSLQPGFHIIAIATIAPKKLPQRSLQSRRYKMFCLSNCDRCDRLIHSFHMIAEIVEDIFSDRNDLSNRSDHIIYNKLFNT